MINLKKRGLLICGHGNRTGSNSGPFQKVVQFIREKYPKDIVCEAFLEYQHPSVKVGLDSLLMQNVERIVLVPVFLFSGVHINNDLPLIIDQFCKENPKVEVVMASNIGLCDELTELCTKLIHKLEQREGYNSNRKDAALLLVGVGTSLVDANADIASLTRRVWEKSGFGFAQYAFISKVATPSIDTILDYYEKIGHKRIYILPALLFSGIYLKQIHSIIDKRRKNTYQELVVTDIFENDDLILKALIMRIESVI